MSRRHKRMSKREIGELCSELGELDGRDPRFDAHDNTSRTAPRKVLQLCSQVARSINEVLAGCGNDLLRDLMVDAVVPAPSSVRLLVTLAPTPAASPVDPSMLSIHLERAKGMIRNEVSSAINRRKTPELVFSLRAE